MALGEDINQLDKKEAAAVKLPAPWIAIKQSMLPKGTSANTSKITYCRICMNTKFVFVLEYDDDNDNDQEDEEPEDNGEIFADISD